MTGVTTGTLPGQTSAGGFDAFLRKYDRRGNELWTRQFGSERDDNASGVFADASGAYVTWTTPTPGPGNSDPRISDAFVRKYDANGNELWTRQLGTSSFEEAFGVSGDASGIYVVGLTLAGGSRQAFVRKYDASGNEVWTRLSGEGPARAFGVFAAASGIYVAGHTFPGAQNDAFVRKYDASGNEVWTRRFGTGSRAIGVFADASGIYVTGRMDGTLPGQISAGNGDGFVRKYDASGNEVWTLQFGSSSLDVALGVSGDASGIYVAGSTRGTLPGQTYAGEGDAFLAKLAAGSPAQLIQNLIAQVAALNLKKGIANSLESKLNAALRSINDSHEGNNTAAVNLLQAFINSVEAQRGVHISNADADALIAAAQAIITQLTE